VDATKPPETLAAKRSATDMRRTVRRLANLNRVAIIIFGILLMCVIVFAGSAANNSSVERDRQQINNAMSKKLAMVLNEQKSIAWWDDAVTNIMIPKINVDWTHENFGIYLSQSFGHDEIYILDSKNRPVYGAHGTNIVPPESFALRQRDASSLIQKVRNSIGKPQSARDDPYGLDEDNYPQLKALKVARASGKFVKIDNQPVVIAVMTIVPNVAVGKLKAEPYLLISVVKIDAKKMAELSSALMIEGLSLSRYPAVAKNRISQPLLNNEGEVIAHLSWFQRKPGDPLLIFILPLVAFAILGVFLMARFMEGRIKSTTENLAESQANALYAANHDMLSQLPNRFQFNARLKEMLEQQDRRNPHRIAIAYLDIDRFKDINDTLGHEAGDILIQAVAQRLPDVMGPHDVIARFGGDEFAIVTQISKKSDVEDFGNRIMKAFEKPCRLASQPIQVSTSIGIAMAPDHGRSVQELFRNADIALYDAKENGRGKWVLFDDAMAARVQQRREIEQDLRTALSAPTLQQTSAGQLTLNYQPIIRARDFKMISVEALIRWNHPTRGNISPAEFIPIAEESGLMPELGDWILDRAFAEATKWPTLEIAINLSPAQFRHTDLLATLQRLTHQHQITPSRIVLEITEGLLLDNSARTRATFDALRAMGFQTALDDFGTGYSSLKYLCEFKFDKIKIDQSFVRAATPDGQAMAIIHAVITVGQGFGMTITAEGVETAVQEKLLRIIGCTELQGFRYSRPVTAEAIDTLLAQGGNLSVFAQSTTELDPQAVTTQA
jgi:diguanylate cyclase (GGDEF)-like protein